jgi:hypothetical protein
LKTEKLTPRLPWEKVKKFASDTRLKLFRVTVSTNRTDYIETSDMTQSDTSEAQKVSGQRWKIEQFPKELTTNQPPLVSLCLFVWRIQDIWKSPSN